MNASGSFVFLTQFLYQATSDQVLKFFISTEAEHFFSTAHCVA